MSESTSPLRRRRGFRGLAVVAAAVLMAVCVSATALGTSLRAPATAQPGAQFTVRASGFLPGSKVELNLAPTASRGGNCCGIQVGGTRTVNRAGKAVFTFSWPASYFFCAGAADCTRVRWKRERADIFVYTTADPNHPASNRRARRTTLVLPAP